PAARARRVAQLRLLRRAQEGAEAGPPAAESEPAPAAPPSFLEALSQRVEEASESIASGAVALLRLPEQAQLVTAALGEPDVQRRVLLTVLELAAILLPAALVQWLLARLVRRPWEQAPGAGRSLWRRLLLALASLTARLVPIAAFAAVAYVVLAALVPEAEARVLALAVINANLLASAVIAVARTALSPDRPALRLLPMADGTAAYAVAWAWRLAVIAAYGYFLVQAMSVLGAPAPLVGLVTRLVGLVLAAIGVGLALRNRVRVAQWLRRGREFGGLGRVRRGFAEIWHIAAIAVIAALYAVWFLNIRGGFHYLLRALALSLVVLVLARLAAALLNEGARRLFALSRNLRGRFPGLEARANRYLPVVRGILRAAVWLIAGLGLLQVWGVRSFDWFVTAPGRRFVGTVGGIVLILLIAIALSELVSSLIARYLTRSAQIADPLARGARIRTLLPLLRHVFQLVLGVVVVLVILSQLGLDIAPLLAGAGVVGLAIGFGAQTLVQDLITGIFILAEDTVSVGDVVDVDGGHAGLVEAMSIRSIRLRDFAGAVHTVPFSQVKTVKNMTKDYSYAVFDVNVPYGADIDEVVAILRETGAALREDEGMRAAILEPIEVVGVDSFGESGVVLKARIKTKPIRQWDVMRAFNRLLKQAFDARGVAMAVPHRTLAFDPGPAVLRVKLERAAATGDKSQAGQPAPAGAEPPPTAPAGGADRARS
ncbi:MAG: mechanosensitive ion channel, partial [Rhodospirillaceae bacterium]|nr:mechanosensitive ion channel [Rhodospirillaceae bacterium]